MPVRLLLMTRSVPALLNHSPSHSAQRIKNPMRLKITFNTLVCPLLDTDNDCFPIFAVFILFGRVIKRVS